MAEWRRFRQVLDWLTRQLLSVPVFFKILGIGVLVAAVFGSITLLQVRSSMSRGLQQMLEQRTRSLASSLAASLERPLSIGDTFAANQKLRRTLQMFPDVKYVIVWDPQGRPLAHTFDRGVPPDLRQLYRQAASGGVQFEVLASDEGQIFDVMQPILEGRAGTLQLGVGDELIARELPLATRSVLWSLAFCAAIGAGLALLLTHILTRPIHHLVGAANRVSAGDFQTRAEVFSADEIGTLAAAFNEMTRGLQRYQQQVDEKERARLLLIEKIVRAQEEERRVISRELHDQLGQSLLALLLQVQSLCKEICRDDPSLHRFCQDIQTRIRQLIDEARRLAWGMRPTILDDYGLDFALARYVEETTQHFGLPIDYQYSCPPGLGRLPARIEVTLYRIAQEAITNAVRHAEASRASAVVLRQHDQVTLIVEDDGRGFNLQAVQHDSDSCLGLTGMRERAALLGGACAVETAPRQGTTVRVTIPLNTAEPCPSES